VRHPAEINRSGVGVAGANHFVSCSLIPISTRIGEVQDLCSDPPLHIRSVSIYFLGQCFIITLREVRMKKRMPPDGTSMVCERPQLRIR